MTVKIRNDSIENAIIHLNSKLTIKKKKISSEEFAIPKHSEFEMINTYNYTVTQLKKIARHYSLAISGNKPVLIDRLVKFLKTSIYATKIQCVFRAFLQKMYNHTHGPAFLNRNLCNNTSDFYTMDEINDIPLAQFFSYKDMDGFIYGFDLLSLYNLILTSDKDPVNPYNRNILPVNIPTLIRNKIRLSHVLKIPIEISIDKNIPTHNAQKRYEMRCLTLFQEIDCLGNYSNSEWFTSLDRHSLIKYLRELMDIWNFRAQLTHEVKCQISPPCGNPLRNASINIIYDLPTPSLQLFILSVMENLVKSGIDRDSRCLGSYYVLAPLTLVNSRAAENMPWLYNSVFYN
jgi:hypothetical protein